MPPLRQALRRRPQSLYSASVNAGAGNDAPGHAIVGSAHRDAGGHLSTRHAILDGDVKQCNQSPAGFLRAFSSQREHVAAISTTAAGRPISTPARWWYSASISALARILIFGMPTRRRSWQTTLGMLALLVALSGGVVGCSGGGGGVAAPAVPAPRRATTP
jgi:hypothetical protein